MNGNFKIRHELDETLHEIAGYKVFNPTAVDLTRLALQHNKTPEEILEMFNKIRAGLLKP